MQSWFGWFSKRTFPGLPGTRQSDGGTLASARTAPLETQVTARTSDNPPLTEQQHASTLAWLLNTPQPEAGPLQTGEADVLTPVHAMLKQRELPAGLLPRAAAVIPQLMRLLKHQASHKEIVDRIAKDLVLTTEVLRIAQGSYYRTQEKIVSLDKAVMMIGVNGVQAAIARVVLKPMYDSNSGGLTGRAANRGWQYSERQADCCADLTAQVGIERYEGFLGGTLHGIGRTALLRVLDRAGINPAWPCSRALDEALTAGSNQLFGRYLMDLRLTPALTEAGQSLAKDGQAGTQGSLAWLLRESERLSTRSLLMQPSSV